MTDIVKQKMSGVIEGDFVVFLIGMRINKYWKFWKWLPVARAMPPMLDDLMRDPEKGLLHSRSMFGFRNVLLVQYWRSFEHLHAFATAPDEKHLPAWKAFNQAIGSNGDVGIWHETYLVRAGQYEAVYNNMPRFGLAMAGDQVPASGKRKSARGRLGLTDGMDQPQ